MRGFGDPNDSQSYEDWMNDLAADDSKPSRGWHSAYQDRCDCCGKFVRADGDGVSWSQSWSYDMDGVPDLHDTTYRCSACTDKHGIKPTNCNETQCKYHGRNPQRISPPATSEADHCYTCPHCGEAVDMRILAQVIHHERDGHGRMWREN